MLKNDNYYNSYSNFIKEKFGIRVQKLSLNVGLTCPNRDGTIGEGGCIYCNNDAFTPSYCNSQKPIEQQLQEGIDFHANRYRRASSYFAYFQAYTNTHTDMINLENMLVKALKVEGVIGLIIGTRPDCVNYNIINVLKKLSSEVFLKVELGIESVYDKTLDFLNRGHNFDTTKKAIELLRNSNINVGGHMILGLPGESRDEILQSASVISKLDLLSIKLHQLQIFRDTRLAEIYNNNEIDITFSKMEDYIDFVIDYTEMLSPKIHIERFAGEVPPAYLVAPKWEKIRYDNILQMIIKRFKERNTYQGRFCK